MKQSRSESQSLSWATASDTRSTFSRELTVPAFLSFSAAVLLSFAGSDESDAAVMVELRLREEEESDAAGASSGGQHGKQREHTEEVNM